MNLRAGITLLSVCLLAVSVWGCGGGVKDVAGDPTLDPAALSAGRIIIAGIGVRPDGVDPEIRDRCGDELFAAMLAGRPDIEVWPQAVLADAVGDSFRAALLERIRFTNNLPAETLAEIAAATPSTRFLAVGRIDADELDRSSGDTAREARAREEGGFSNAMAVETKLKRQVTVTLQLFDLETGKTVWSGTAERSRTTSHSFVEDGGREYSTGVSRLPGDRERSGQDYEPDLAELAGRAFADLVERLPAGGEG